MPPTNYEALYHLTQQHITRSIQVLEEELSRLKALQCICEEAVVCSDFELHRQAEIQPEQKS